MHPNSALRSDTSALLAEVERIGFAHLFVVTPDGPMIVHAPVTLHGDALRFHVARANRATRHLDGATVLLSLAGVDGYVSPNWYVTPGDQVPTWNYVSVEVEGTARAIDGAALVEQLDRMASLHEPRDAPWTRAKMNPAVFAAMLTAIRGFEIAVTAVRGITKLGQNKTAADRAGVVAGLRREGRDALARVMETIPSR